MTHLRQHLHALQAGVHGEHAADGDAADAHRRAHRDAARQRELQHALRAARAISCVRVHAGFWVWIPRCTDTLHLPWWSSAPDKAQCQLVCSLHGPASWCNFHEAHIEV